MKPSDQRECIDTMVHYRRQPRENYVTTSIEKIAAITCEEGYSVENGNCSGNRVGNKIFKILTLILYRY